ncbi:unnamed protein product [Pseudo-nitzschia multistriata]|uniref:carbonic anhydrase n=1 Tax=Pseudo-nitzschia multistriata TaxID=183589 RepID=A0A448Z7W9_9STRA|nr:unnamed protein product [Pseudo-nitzschia multistriata]
MGRFRPPSFSSLNLRKPFFFCLVLLYQRSCLVDARSWSDILSPSLNDASYDGKHHGHLRNKHYRPGELSFEIEEDPFYFPPPTKTNQPNQSQKEARRKKNPFINNRKDDEIANAATTITITQQQLQATKPRIPKEREHEQLFSGNIFVHESNKRKTNKEDARAPVENILSKNQGDNNLGSNRRNKRSSSSISRVFVMNPTESLASVLPTEDYREKSLLVDSFTRTGAAAIPFDANDDADRDAENDSKHPTVYYDYPEHSVTPLNPPLSYFNYDTSSDSRNGPGTLVVSYSTHQNEFVSKYGNNAWADSYQPPPPVDPNIAVAMANRLSYETNDSNSYSTSYYYWDEFGPEGYGFGPWKGTLTGRKLRTKNQCGNVGRQSPIDIRLTGVACLEHHQIRTRKGDFKLKQHRPEHSNLKLSILPSKLRVWFQRRPCSDLENPVCSEPDPPHADFPHGWGGFADVLHVDFKFPAEHTIYGQTFDGEMQIYHLHPGRRRLPVVSVLMKVAGDDNGDGNNDDGHNEYLQRILDGFQYEYDTNRAKCAIAAIDAGHRRRKLQQRQHGEPARPGGGTPTKGDHRGTQQEHGGEETISFSAEGFDSGTNAARFHAKATKVTPGRTNFGAGHGSKAAKGDKRTKHRNKQHAQRASSSPLFEHDEDHFSNLSGLEIRASAAFGGNRERLEEYARLLLPNNGTGNDGHGHYEHQSNINATTDFTIRREAHRRRLSTSRWNPHHRSLVPSYYFYGYDGSLTEPPCSEIVSWFVMDGPHMEVSFNQLEQAKAILFTNVDGSSCRETSVHYRNSVARPIQDTGPDRDVWHCTRDNYVPDKERQGMH